METRSTAPRPWRDFARMRPFLRPYLGRMAVMIGLSLTGALLGLAQPYLSKYLVDEALLRHDLRALWWSAALMLGAAVISFGLSYVSGIGYLRVSTAMLFDMRLTVYRHLHALSPRFHARARLGDLVSRLNGDIAEVQRISADTVLSTLTNVCFAIGSLVMMVWLSGSLFIAGILLVPLSIALVHGYQGRLTRQSRDLREKSASIGALFVETLLGVRLVNCFHAGEYEVGRFRDANQSYIDTLMRFQRTSLLARSLPGLVLTLATVGVFLYGGARIIAGEMTIGTLVAFLAYHARLISPLQNLLGLSASLATARVALGRVLELLDEPVEVREPADARPFDGIRQEIRFEDVTVRHEDRTVLDRVSFSIPAGVFCVITGPSGAGKSTLADLMIRLIDPDGGRVVLDGQDVRSLRLADLRRAVVLIDQTPHLLRGTLRENIAYSRPLATDQEIVDAALGAGLGSLLNRLAQGLDTICGERGLTLSAGERHRVALARAFLADPSVVILDEPSAALDPDCERDLIERVRRHFAQRTVVVITHKPAFAEAATWTVRLNGGQVIPREVAA
jgi:ATP-binding cassette subfamily B protein